MIASIRRFWLWLTTPRTEYVSAGWLRERNGRTYDNNPRAHARWRE